MCATTFTVRIDSAVKERLERLERLSTSTGCSRSFLAAEAISGYLSLLGQAPTGYLRAVPDIGSHPAARFPGV
jgi:hypothetical protein